MSARAEIKKAPAHVHDPAKPCLACCYYPCAHCTEDIGSRRKYGAVLPDSGADCPTCHEALCQRCAGGWCS